MSSVTPMILTTGFLGAGKTTTVNKMLEFMDKSQTAVIVNEFGAVSIDGMLLKGDPLQITNLPNGCACCTVSDEFSATLKQVLETKKPHSVVFETSGVANPVGVLNAIYNSDLCNICRVDLLVTIVDGDRFESLVDEVDVFLDQVMPADLLVVNKADLITESRRATIEKGLRSANPKAPIVFATQGDINWKKYLDPELVKKIQHSEKERRAQIAEVMDHHHDHGHDDHLEHHHHHGDHNHGEDCGGCSHPDHHHEHHHHHHHHAELEDFNSVAIDLSSPLDPKLVDKMVQKLPKSVFRGKGLLKLKGYDGWFLFQSVAARYEIRPYQVAEGIDPKATLVFIGKNVQPSQLYQLLGACV